MKNITLSADEDLIERARRRARERRRTLNEEFRDWLKAYSFGGDPDAYRSIMSELASIDAGRAFTRDEANER